MSGTFIFACFIAYTILIFFVTWFTSRKSNNDSYFIGNKQSPWYVVAYGMIGASLSGVTFMSVPGWVGNTHFSYFMVVLGYLAGYAAIALILLPLYYKLKLTSIYSYLEQRYGFWSYKTGAFYFILSRVIGASFRMFLVVNVLQIFVFDAWNIPFWVTVLIFITLIILYTFEGGIKTIIWTDTLQTTFMIAAVVISIVLIAKELDWNVFDVFNNVLKSDYSQVIYSDWLHEKFYLKQFLSGAFITITMTGLDQEMMQKNLSCKSLKDAQKNMFTFSGVLVIVNMMFLFLGALLYFYASSKNIAIPASSDDLFPILAIKFLGPLAALVFIIGLISAAYPSADGALTSLTTSFCIDFLGFNKHKKWTEAKKKKIRYLVHISFALLLFTVIVIFRMINNQAVISKLFTVAGYTYGPLLGLYAFGLFSKNAIKDKWVPLVCLLSPIICYFLSEYSSLLITGYKIGFELIIINGALTYFGLWLLRKKK